jgi:hypothetical protein
MTRYIPVLFILALLLVLAASITPAEAQGVDPLVQSLDGAQFVNVFGVTVECWTINGSQASNKQIIRRPERGNILSRYDPMPIVGRQMISSDGVVRARITPNGIISGDGSEVFHRTNGDECNF